MRTALDRRGFTLIEVMVAVALASFGLLVLTNLFARGYSTNQYALEYTKAVLLAKQKLEEFRLAPKYRLESLIEAAKAPSSFKDSSGNLVNPGFEWSAAVINRWQDLIEVQVKVSWGWPNGGRGVKNPTKHVKLNSYF